MKSLLRLFKAVYVKEKKKAKIDKITLALCLKNGLILSPKVIHEYTNPELIKIIATASKELSLTAEEANSSFHKSWNKIKTASLEQLVIEQILHYITTYGFERLGFYDESLIYIPKEKLDIPKIDIDEIKLINIKGYTKSEVKDKVMSMLQSGIALRQDTINDILNVLDDVGITEEEVETVKNREMKIALYKKLDLFPKAPIEFLRYIVYIATEKTLLIKDKETFEKLKIENKTVYKLFKKYDKKFGLESLSQIFYRFKPLFLALRHSNEEFKPLINRIRKLAVKNHIPMKEDYLNGVTANIKTINSARLKKELEKANIFRRIRLAYALKFRTKNNESILYKIRNGKSYATSFDFKNQTEAKKIYSEVMDSILNEIRPLVKGKKIHIPEYVTYALPSTEKQFVGDFPYGSCITVPDNMIVGINWHNVKGNRIDLDFSMLNAEAKIGWDANYRGGSNDNILFSGDMTDASGVDGSSELFYFAKQKKDNYIFMVNYFNHDADCPVPYKIFVAKDVTKNIHREYIVDPNKILAMGKSEISNKQKMIGLAVMTTANCKFYFVESSIGKSITSSGKPYVAQSRQYLLNYYTDTISLNEVLERSGAILTKSKEKANVDLSPESLEKDKILKLLIKN